MYNTRQNDNAIDHAAEDGLTGSGGGNLPSEERKRGKYLMIAATCIVGLIVWELFAKNACKWLLLLLFSETETGGVKNAPVYPLTREEIELLTASVNTIISRLFGFAAAAFFVKYFGYRTLGKTDLKGLAKVAPCFLIAFTNPPILSLLFGNSWLNYTGGKMFAFAAVFFVECFAVAAFEETLFRGTLFVSILENHREGSKEIFISALISSAVFALAHLLNLFSSPIGAVLLQTGYSFLLGGMCAYTLLRTKNLSFCVVLHAAFNFCGMITEKFGGGAWNSVPIIVFTCIFGSAVAAWIFYDFAKMKKLDTDCFVSKTR